MVDNCEKIEKLKEDIEICRSKNSYTRNILAGKKLKELYDITKDIKHIDEAIEAFSNAIELEEKPEGYIERATLYILKNENDSAFADFKRACKIYKPSENYCDDLYIKNHLEEMSQLICIKDSIAKLKDEEKIDEEFLKFYESLNKNCVKLNKLYDFEHYN